MPSSGSSAPVAQVGKAAGASMPVETGIQREISAKVDDFTKTFVDARADGGEVRARLSAKGLCSELTPDRRRVPSA